MQKEKFGKICASLRQDRFDPLKGRAWTQEDLAQISGLHPRIIGQIERGEKVKIDADVLRNLAQAFGLTTVEKQRFYTLAHVVDDALNDPDSIKNTITNAQKIKQPLLLHDGYYRIIKVNSAFLSIYGLTTEYLESIPDDDPTKYQIVRHIHDPNSPVRKVYKKQLSTLELNNVIYWRYFSMAHRHTALFNEIQSVLFQKCPNFAYLWNSLNHKLLNMDVTNLTGKHDIKHPHLGNLNYLGVTTNIQPREQELFMATLLPTDSQTLSVFGDLVRCSQFNVVPGAILFE